MCGVLALLFLVVPAVEIYVIIEVGGLLGTWATLVVIAVTAIVGASLAKSQGVAVLTRLQESMGSGEGTGTALIEGVLVLAAGVTLLAPGFLTDAVGLALLIPPVRALVASKMAERMAMSTHVQMGGPAVFYQERDDDDPPPPGVIDV